MPTRYDEGVQHPNVGATLICEFRLARLGFWGLEVNGFRV